MPTSYLPEIETRPLKEIKRFQEKKLKELLLYLDEHSPYYHRLFENNKVTISGIKTLEDLRQIPLTSKDELQQYNEDFICVPKNRIIDYITTSGTSGEPVTFAMTEKDLERIAYNECISFACADGTQDDIYQLMTTIDRRFMAGLCYRPPV